MKGTGLPTSAAMALAMARFHGEDLAQLRSSTQKPPLTDLLWPRVLPNDTEGQPYPVRGDSA
jgi:hypothetical protein